MQSPNIYRTLSSWSWWLYDKYLQSKYLPCFSAQQVAEQFASMKRSKVVQ